MKRNFWLFFVASLLALSTGCAAKSDDFGPEDIAVKQDGDGPPAQGAPMKEGASAPSGN